RRRCRGAEEWEESESWTSIWAAPSSRATKPGTFAWCARYGSKCQARSPKMADDREKISTGPNDRPLNETIAGTGPGIPDAALAPGEELPNAPSDEEVERIAEKIGAPTAERDTLPLEGE